MTTIRLGLILIAWGCAEPTAVEPRPAAPAVLERHEHHSYSIVQVDRSVHVRFTDVRNEGEEPVYEFVRRMFQSADSAGATRLVVDLRSISRSDTFVLVPLLKGILARDRFLEHGSLVVLLGSESFSPRQNLATLLRQYANPIFVRDMTDSLTSRHAATQRRPAARLA